MTTEITVPIPRTRRELFNALDRIRREYLKATGRQPSLLTTYPPEEQLINDAMNLIAFVAHIEELTPIASVTIGEAPAEATRTKGVAGLSTTTVRHLADIVEQLQGHLVRRLRQLGVPWSEIGRDCLGMTGQGASKKAIEKGWVSATDVES